MKDEAIAKYYDFDVVSDYIGYISSRDKTKVDKRAVVSGSQNMYRKVSGNWATRDGQKRYGAADQTQSAAYSPYVWKTSWGQELPIIVANGNLYVVSSVTGTPVWYSLATGLTKTRHVFDKWYDQTQGKDRLLFVNGTSTLGNWSGGISLLASGSNAAGSVAQLLAIPTNAGTGYTVGDILNITTGGTLATARVDTVGTGAVLTVSVTNGGRGYTVGDVLSLAGGDFGTGATVTVSTIGAGGVITAVTLTTAGIGYSTGLDYKPTGGTGNSAFINTATVSPGGSITSVSLVSPGSGYSAGSAKATTGGTGTGATLNIVTIATGFILKSVTTTTFQQDGFSSSGTIVVSGTSYAYSYIVGNYLVGVTPNPTGIVTGSVGVQAITSYPNFLPAVGALSDFIKVINNRLYSGSYTSRVVNHSSASDFTNFVVPLVTIPGSANYITLDAAPTGIGVRQGNPHIGYGTSSWMVLTYPTHTNSQGVLVEQITPDIKPVSNLAAPYAHEFIDTVGDTLVYLAQDQQVRTFGNFTNLFTAAYPSISQQIKTELEAEVFTGGMLRCIGDLTYLIAPNAGRVYLYEVRENVDQNGQVVSERGWYSPFIWNITGVGVIGGTVYGFSNSNPQIYQLWGTNQWHDDSPTDEPLPYSCVLAFAYRNGTDRTKLYEFDKIYTEGYIAPGTPLNILVNYEYEGTTEQSVSIVNSISAPAYLYDPASLSMGDSSLGDEPLGDITTTSGNMLPKFRAINSISHTNVFEWQPVYSSDTADARWEIEATGANMRRASGQPTYIINKRGS